MTILKMDFLAGILILVIMMIRMIMLQHLPKKTFLVLWSIVVYRLLVPFFVSSKFSVCTLINRQSEISIDRNVVSSIAPVIPSTVVITNTAGMIVLFMKVLWFTGICVCALFFLISHFRCLMKYKMSLPIENAFIERWKQEHSIRRKVDIRQSDRITTPLTYGEVLY